MGPGGRFKIKDGIRERGHGLLLSKEAAWGSGKFLALGQVQPLPAARSQESAAGSLGFPACWPCLVQEASLGAAHPHSSRLRFLRPAVCLRWFQMPETQRVDVAPALTRAKLRERRERRSSVSETRSDQGARQEEWDGGCDRRGGCLQGTPLGPRPGARRERAGAVGMVAGGQSRDWQAMASTWGFILRTTGKPQRGLSRRALS